MKTSQEEICKELMIAESHSSEQIIDMADGMMYEVKHGTKDNVQAAVWDGISFRKT